MWKIKCATWESTEAENYLDLEYEPFAVTRLDSRHYAMIWFRKWIEEAE